MHHPTQGRARLAHVALRFSSTPRPRISMAWFLALALFLLGNAPEVRAAAGGHAGPGAGLYEVAGPLVASPTRATLAEVRATRAVGAGSVQSTGVGPRRDARAEAWRMDVEQLGLDASALPPAHATSLGLPPNARALHDPQGASLEIVEQHPALFGVDPEMLELVSVRETPRLTYVHFRQKVGGYPVMHSEARFNWDTAGRLAKAGADVFVDDLLAPAAQSRRDPTWVGLREAQAGAIDGMPAELEVREWEYAEQAWLPVEAGEGDGHRLVAVWNVRFRTDEPAGWWDTVVDGETGGLLSRINRIHFETIEGAIDAAVEPASPGDVQVTVPLAHAAVDLLRDGSVLRTGHSDATGGFAFEAPDGGEYTISTRLRGRYIWVRNLSTGTSTPAQDLPVSGPEVRPSWVDGNSWVSERDAFYHGNVARDYVRRTDPTSGMAPLDQPMRTEIENPGGTCNAFWDGVRMSFYAAGGGCPSTARIADVVYHEYGHAVTQMHYLPSFGPSDIHEGMADYLAATITDQPYIGRGFFGPGSTLRDIETDRVWPDDRHADPHIQGLIVAGAFWDLRKVLGRDLTDELAHFSRYGKPRTFDAYLLEVLVYDDDDADLANGTPHWDEIVEAFAAHGVGDYTVQIVAPMLPDLEVSNGTIDATLRIWSLLGLDEGELAFYYRSEDMAGFERVPLQSTGVRREYRVSIPAPRPESRVYYYWSAADTVGHRSYLPESAPQETFSFYYGVDEIAPVISHDPFDAITPDFTSLYMRAGATDNSQRITDFHAVVRGVGGGESEVPLVAREAGLYEAWLPLGAIGVGETVAYRLVATDGAALANQATVPSEGSYSVSVRAGRGSDFEDDAGDLVGTRDWEWGTPSDPSLRFSGDRVWATSLTGNYSDAGVSFLEFGPFDLSVLDRARLQFMHTYRFERGYDGGALQVSINGGTHWTLLTPQDGYSHPIVPGLAFGGQAALPGFSGTLEGWEAVTVPLDRYLEHSDVRVRFVMGADPFETDLGWYVDDVMLVAAQARADAINFVAEDGMDDRVELRWQSPRGIDLESGRFLGFDVYRGEGAQASDLVKLNDTPLAGYSYLDDQVNNGETYLYRMVAVYDEGDSRGVYDTGSPFAATVALDVAEVSQVINDYSTKSSTVTVRNIGPGTLRYELFLADPEQVSDDVILRYRIPAVETTGFERIWTDRRNDANQGPDLQAIEARRWVDDGTPMLEFKLRGYAPWGDPTRDWGGVLLFDTDRNVEDTQAVDFGWGEGENLGYELGVVFGVLPSQADLGTVEAALFDASLAQQPETLRRVHFPADSDSLTFSVPMRRLQGVTEMRMGLVLAPGLGRTPSDWAPERPASPWLSRDPRGGLATSAGASVFQLKFDPAGLPNGRYDARTLLVSNDELNPSLDIPVTLYVDRALPNDLAKLVFTSSPAGLQVDFRFRSEVVPDSISVERRANGGDWIHVEHAGSGEPGTYRVLDRGLVPGERYFYRVFVRSFDGRTKSYGPAPWTYAPVIPDLQALAFASQIRGLHMSFRAPSATSASVWRSREDAEFVALTPAGLAPDSTDTFVYVDTTPDPGVAYRYRFDVVLEGNLQVVYGPFAAVFDRPQPALDELVVESADEGVRVSFVLPAELEDAQSVRVERASEFDDSWAVVHEIRGTMKEAASVSLIDRWLRGDEGPEVGGVEAGEAYRYRIVVVLSDAEPLVYGPFPLTFEPPVPLEVRLHAGRPNPFRGEVLLRLDLPQRTSVALEVFDASGRLRATVVDGMRGPGIERLLWDGRDATGQALPSGVYWARLRTPERTQTIRLVRTR